jgi:hypothetical protein
VEEYSRSEKFSDAIKERIESRRGKETEPTPRWKGSRNIKSPKPIQQPAHKSSEKSRTSQSKNPSNRATRNDLSTFLHFSFPSQSHWLDSAHVPRHDEKDADGQVPSLYKEAEKRELENVKGTVKGVPWPIKGLEGMCYNDDQTGNSPNSLMSVDEFATSTSAH